MGRLSKGDQGIKGAALTATLIYNPVSGEDPKGKRIKAVREALEQVGIPYQFQETLKARDGTRIAKEAVASGSNFILAAGGDGTANEVVNALVGTEAKLALIPLGTGNLAAHEFGIPQDPVEAVKLIPKCRVERIDVGKANDRYFLMMASLGLDAKALRDAPKWMYRFLHWWAFYATGLFSLFTSRVSPVSVKVEGEEMTFNTRLLVISNIKGYGLPGCQFFSDASVTDGFLNLGTFKSQGFFSYLTGFRKLGAKKPLAEALLDYCLVKSVHITTDTPIPVQLDGDFYGYTPLEISVVPKSLSILTFPFR